MLIYNFLYFFLAPLAKKTYFNKSKPAGPLSQDMLSLGGCFFMEACFEVH
jgi:hypothetical protein